MTRWIFLSAGLGSSNFQEAGNRISSEAKKIYPFSKIVILTNENINEICPESAQKYREYLREDIRGFGFMCWKSEICRNAFDGLFGQFDGIVWADAGCEIESNAISKIYFKIMLLRAKRYGYVSFTLKTSEEKYTKRAVLDKFKITDEMKKSPQFQTTFFILHGSKGKKLAERWQACAMSDIKMLDESESDGGEIEGFVAHRHDQSLFSLTLKEENGHRNLLILPNGRSRGIKRFIGKAFPVKATRNRTGSAITGAQEK